MYRCITMMMLLMCMFAAGCYSDDITSPSDIVFPEQDVSYGRHVAPLFALSCNFTGCHDASRVDNKYTDLTTWSGVRSLNVAIPYDTSCGLIRVVYGRQFHNGVLNLNFNHIQGLKTWILEGAQNN